MSLAGVTDGVCSEAIGDQKHDEISLNVHVFNGRETYIHVVSTSRARLASMGGFFQAQLERWTPGAVCIRLPELEWQAFKRLLAGEELKRVDVHLLWRVAAHYCLEGLQNEIGHLEMAQCRNCKLSINGFNLQDRCYVQVSTDWITSRTHCISFDQERTSARSRSRSRGRLHGSQAM